jgi:hypothetical protein
MPSEDEDKEASVPGLCYGDSDAKLEGCHIGIGVFNMGGIIGLLLSL